MNGKTCYIGFALTVVSFFIVFNAYNSLQSDITKAEDRIDELKTQIDEQSKPCQEEDLKFPELSTGCTIPPTSSSPPTPSGENQNGAEQSSGGATVTPDVSQNGGGGNGGGSQPKDEPPPPKSDITGREPILGCRLGICI